MGLNMQVTSPEEEAAAIRAIYPAPAPGRKAVFYHTPTGKMTVL
jgi:hypothetical protein